MTDEPESTAAGIAHGLYRKRPVVIRAYRTDRPLVIPTLEGDMRACPGDWIITGVNGEQYPCQPDIFAKTYEPAMEETTTVTDAEDRAEPARE